MKNRILVMIVILLVILNSLILFFENYYNQILIIGGNTIVEYRNNKLLKIKKINRINKRLNYKKYSVYNDSKFEDYYINFEYGDYNNISYTLFNNSDDETSITESLLAYTNDLNIKVSPIKNSYVMTNDDKKIFKQVLPGYNLDSVYFNKIIVDLNNDGLNEEIYIINNFNLINIQDNIVSYVFLRTSNGNIIDVLKNESSDQSKVPAYRFCYAVDIDNDNNYEIILSEFYNESKVNYNIYKYNLITNEVTELK